MIRPSYINHWLREVPADLYVYLRAIMGSAGVDGDALKLRPPQDTLMIDHGVTSVVLHREGQYQAELIIVAPNVEIPPHEHPDVDSYEVALAGEIAFFVDGIQTGYRRTPAANGMSRDFGKFVPIRSDAPHSGVAGPMGTVFLSVQKWREGVQPTHVGMNWIGHRVKGD